LRIIFWLTVLEFVVATGQLIYYWRISHAGLTHLQTRAGGALAVSLYVLSLAALLMGVFARRRIFAALVLVTGSASGISTLWLNVDLARVVTPFILSRPFAPATYLDPNLRYFLWNSVVGSIDAVIVFYIWHYELHRNE
jgi:hypothetical protein